MMTLRNLATALGFIVAIASAPAASAAPVLRLIVNDLATAGNEVDITSGTGLVVFNGGLGNWIVNVVTGLGDQVTDPDSLDLNSVNVSSASGGQLAITLIQTGSSFGTGAGILDFLTGIGGTLGAGAGNSISFVAALDGTTGCAGTVTTPGAAFSNSCSFPASVADFADITMSLSVLITHTNLAATSFDYSAQVTRPVDESGILFLLSSGLIALALVRRRRAA